MTDRRSFASTSLPRHLARGALGFGALAGSVLLVPVVGPVGLLPAPLGLLALRGCPLCWAIGLLQTISNGRLRRACGDGRCELSVARHAPSHGGARDVSLAPGPPRRGSPPGR
ncbi:hypothetical protein AB0I84_33550 [Streptomyces spectabilis]|uniref:hypothetical protein n=1 Tax=Streptomyces spectabilis TaxID=68270 RepID=UPI0033C768E2